ncbi:DUF2207 domain-containing protein [Humibacter ginsenosidimutans]|uniref:DUF2207 domain-containing protein n=1 Tax=Humibacter ginsenosidimutans TaxID=2599293 RepID=UPI00143DF1C5|nr:DUF2207 domain-containing protein [Humibacter ginsenosidimutans]
MHRLTTVFGMLALAAALIVAPAFVPTAAHAASGSPAADTVSAGRAAEGPRAAGSVGAVGADVNDFTFQSMHADYTLGRDSSGASTLKVVETFVADFPQTDQNHGMRRSIPDTYQGQPNDPQLVSITDGDGNPREAEVSDDDGTFSMTSREAGFVHGAQTYVFTYTLRHVTLATDDDDEFYWDVNGVDWTQPFGVVSATLHMPAELRSARNGKQSCYHGAQGSHAQCSITSSEDGTVEASVTGVAANETVTIAVGFAKSTFVPFDASPFGSGWAIAALIAALVGIVAVVLAILARLRLRDAPGRPTIIAEYTPPPGVDALESALLLGRTQKAIPAEILEQAVSGSIRIVDGGRRFGKPVLSAELVDATKADADGRLVLDALFAKGPTFDFSRPNSRFANAVQGIQSTVRSELVARGYYRKVPATVRLWPILLGVLSFAAMMLFSIIALISFVTPWPMALVIIWAILVLIAVLVLVSHRPLDDRGAEVRDHLDGLKIFIDWTDADRIRTLQSPTTTERTAIDTNDPRQMLKLYETLLPFAVVYGQEKEWARQLAVYSQASGIVPVWYVGSLAGFDAASFSAGIGALSTAAMSSSSTGGAGGGGFAGGGGGGGGGGGV